MGDRRLRKGVIDAARAAGDRPAAIEVHRAAQLDIDGARDPALDLVGGARLVDVDLLQQLGRDVGEIVRASVDQIGPVAVDRRLAFGKAAGRDRSEERRVGTEWVSNCMSRWSRSKKKKK